MEDVPKRYEPHEAAAMLGMSGANLRRLAPIYERVYGDLPRDVRRGRVWPDDAIDRLKRARDAVRAGRAQSVQAALVAERTGEDVGGNTGDALPAPNTLAELIAEIRALRRTIEDQSRRIVEQGRRLEALESAEAHDPSELPTQPTEGSTIVPRDVETLSLLRMVLGVILSVVAWVYPFWSLYTLPFGYVPGVDYLYRTLPVESTQAMEAWLRLFLWVLALAVNLGFGFWYGRKKRGIFSWSYVGPVSLWLGVASATAILVMYIVQPGSGIPILPRWMAENFYAIHARIITIISLVVPPLLFTSGAALGNALQRLRTRGTYNTPSDWSARKQTIGGVVGLIVAAIITAIGQIISAPIGNGV